MGIDDARADQDKTKKAKKTREKEEAREREENGQAAVRTSPGAGRGHASARGRFGVDVLRAALPAVARQFRRSRPWSRRLCKPHYIAAKSFRDHMRHSWGAAAMAAASLGLLPADRVGGRPDWHGPRGLAQGGVGREHSCRLPPATTAIWMRRIGWGTRRCFMRRQRMSPSSSVTRA